MSDVEGSEQPGAATIDDRPALTHRHIIWLITGLLLAQMCASIEGTVVSTAYPTIARDLGGLDRISWIFTAYLLAATASTPLWGKLSDLLGRRRLYEASLLIFMVGSILCGAAASMDVLIWARALQGIGSGGLFTLTMTIMGDVLSPRERGKYQGYMMAVYSSSTVLGPLVGGLLVDYAHWRWIFFMNLPLGIAALALSHATLRLPFTRRRSAIDVAGVVLLIVWVTGALLVMKLGQGWGWTSSRTVAVTLVSVAGIVLFVAQQHRHPEPVLPPRLFRVPIFTISALSQFFIGAVMFAVVLYAPLFLQVVTGLKATSAGLLTGPMTIGMLAGSTMTGRRITRTGRYKRYPTAGAVLVTVSCLLMASMSVGTSMVLTAAWMLLFGFGAGVIFITVLLGVQNKVEHEDLGIATSAVNFFRSLGNTFGTALFGSVFISRLDAELDRLVPGSGLSAATLNRSPAQIRELEPVLRDGVVQSFANALHIVFLLGVPICVVAMIVLVFFPEHPLRDHAAVGTSERADNAETSPVSPVSPVNDEGGAAAPALG